MDEEIKQEGQVQELEQPLDRMTAKELREIALTIPGIDGVHAMKKEELLSVIKKAKGIPEDEGPKKRKASGKSDLTALQIKAKIQILKDKKSEARGSRNRAKVDVLRRRINRLKKQSRRAAKG